MMTYVPILLGAAIGLGIAMLWTWWRSTTEAGGISHREWMWLQDIDPMGSSGHRNSELPEFHKWVPSWTVNREDDEVVRTDPTKLKYWRLRDKEHAEPGRRRR